MAQDASFPGRTFLALRECERFSLQFCVSCWICSLRAQTCGKPYTLLKCRGFRQSSHGHRCCSDALARIGCSLIGIQVQKRSKSVHVLGHLRRRKRCSLHYLNCCLILTEKRLNRRILSSVVHSGSHSACFKEPGRKDCLPLQSRF